MEDALAVELGKKVACNLLLCNNIHSLEKEIDYILSNPQLVERFNESVFARHTPQLLKLVKIFVKFMSAVLKEGGPNDLRWRMFKRALVPSQAKMTDEGLFSLFPELKGKTLKDKNLKNYGAFVDYIFEKETQRAHLLLLYHLFKEGETGVCRLCGRTSLLKRNSFFLVQLNKTNYSEGGSGGKQNLCVHCFLFELLANVFPSPLVNNVTRLSNEINLSLFVFSANSLEIGVNDSAAFFSHSFSDFILHAFISQSIDPSQRFYLVFWQAGEQNSNVSIITTGYFNTASLFSKMLKNDSSSVAYFQYLFLNNNILFSPPDSNNHSFERLGKRIFPMLMDFLQTGFISATLINNLLYVFSHNIPKAGKYTRSYIRYLYYFHSFLHTYFEVRSMNLEKVALEEGRRVGRSVYNAVISAEGNDKVEQMQKFVVATSGVMNLSANTFLNGLLRLSRSYQVSVPLYHLTDIAKSERARSAFLVGLLSGVYEGENYGKKE